MEYGQKLFLIEPQRLSAAGRAAPRGSGEDRHEHPHRAREDDRGACQSTCTSRSAPRRSCASTACSTRSTSRRPPAQELREAGSTSCSTTSSATTSTTHSEIDFAFGVLGPGPLPRQHLHAARHPGAGLRHVPVEVPPLEDLGLPPVGARAGVLAARAGAGHRPHRLGQVHHAGGHDRRGQPRDDHAQRHHGRGPDRVPPPRPACRSSTSARSGSTRTVVPDGLRHILRQDPDIILVGEIRDRETMSTALMAADTGHLVLSTLHTTDVVQTVQRIISFYPPHQHDEVRLLDGREPAGGDLAAPDPAPRRRRPRAGGRGAWSARRPSASTSCNPDKTPLLHQAMPGGRHPVRHADLRPVGDGAVARAASSPRRRRCENCNNPNELQLKLKGIQATSDRTLAAGGRRRAATDAAPRLPAAARRRPAEPARDWMPRE